MSLRTVVSPPYLTTSFLSVCEPLYRLSGRHQALFLLCKTKRTVYRRAGVCPREPLLTCDAHDSANRPDDGVHLSTK